MQPSSLKPTSQYVIGIPVYDGVDLLDVAVPVELFGWLAEIEPDLVPSAPERVVKLVSVDGKSVTARGGMTLGGDLQGLDEAGQFNLLWVPGGHPDSLQKLMQDRHFNEFLKHQSEAAHYVTSVCEGALLLAAAGLLDGYRATTHWAFIACLKLFPQIRVSDGYPRYVIDGNRVTGGGISSGMDEALKLISLISTDIVARKVQLTVQYHPRPPFHDGDPAHSGPPIYDRESDGVAAFPGIAETIKSLLSAQRCE